MTRLSLRRAAAGAALAGLILPAAAVAGALVGARDDLDPDERAAVARLVAPPTDFSVPEPFEAMPGGSATSRAAPGPESLAQPVPGLTGADAAHFAVGSAVFRKLWVAAPSSTHGSDGLGPLYDARSCNACHLRDGRGRAMSAEGGDGVVLRLGIPGSDGRATPDPVYGGQLQQAAVAGLAAEGRATVRWTEVPVTLADGTVVSLRKPAYAIADPAFGVLQPMETGAISDRPDGSVRSEGARAPGLAVSPRMAGPLAGMGLLAAVDASDIRAGADPDDADGDGISGRAATVTDPVTGAPALGRFGWKAAQPSLKAQAAAAFLADMGLSTPVFPEPWGDCTAAETACREMPSGADASGAEVPAVLLDAVADYLARLAVPMRRDAGEPAVLAGKRLFHAAGCAACHRPAFVTRRDAEPAALAYQPIRPYTDLLLHDMGEGLSDGLPEGDAAPREWRTPPLWGIGLAETVRGGPVGYLHDGRARDLAEAILWHGGEGEAARDRFAALDAADRNALIIFLKSL